MDIYRIRNCLFRKLDLQRRIHALQTGLGPISANWPSLVWVFLSIIFGISAHQQSSQSSVRSWIATHPPSNQLWSHLLGSNGFVKIKKNDLIEKMYRTLPISMNEGHEIWIDNSSNWVAISPSEFFCRICDLKAGLWTAEPSNWNSYLALESRLPKHRSVPIRKVKENWDPREIRY
jgi:hypothetical protein